ncbi:MAG: ankyrin repeat domain-containing protein [Tepidisphaeraceae bacterium]
MDDHDALVQSAFDGDTDGVRRLLDSGVSVDAANENWNALHAAIENEQFDCVRLLVERGANIEAVNSSMTPLAHAVDIACDGSNQLNICREDADAPTDIVDYLLSAGADPVPGQRTAEVYANEKFARLLRAAAATQPGSIFVGRDGIPPIRSVDNRDSRRD